MYRGPQMTPSAARVWDPCFRGSATPVYFDYLVNIYVFGKGYEYYYTR